MICKFADYVGLRFPGTLRARTIAEWSKPPESDAAEQDSRYSG